MKCEEAIILVEGSVIGIEILHHHGVANGRAGRRLAHSSVVCADDETLEFSRDSPPRC